jgi:hypothetical protein
MKLVVIALKGEESFRFIFTEIGVVVTVFACIGVSDIFLPPLLVFPRKNMKLELLDGPFPQTQLEYATPQCGYSWKFSLIASQLMTCVSSTCRPLLWHEECEDIEMAQADGAAVVCLHPHKMEPLNMVSCELL